MRPFLAVDFASNGSEAVTVLVGITVIVTLLALCLTCANQAKQFFGKKPTDAEKINEIEKRLSAVEETGHRQTDQIDVFNRASMERKQNSDQRLAQLDEKFGRIEGDVRHVESRLIEKITAEFKQLNAERNGATVLHSEQLKSAELRMSALQEAVATIKNSVTLITQKLDAWQTDQLSAAREELRHTRSSRAHTAALAS